MAAKPNDPAFRYDVGISFLAHDEPLATQLYDRLSPHLSVFVYSKKQETLAGTDGLESFRSAFRRDGRVVVVLYRDGWGQTPWTRVEDTAIKERGLEQGWDWLLFVILDATSKPPKWLPETRVRMSLPDYGLDQVVGAIKARAQEAGSVFRKDSAVEKAERVERRATIRVEREQRLGSAEGVKAANEEVRSLFAEIERLVAVIRERSSSLGLQAGVDNPRCIITTGEASVALYWHQRYQNTLNDSGLAVREFIGRLALPQQSGTLVNQPEEILEQWYQFDLTPEHGWCWREQTSGQHVTSAALADYCVTRLLRLTEDVDTGRLSRRPRRGRLDESDEDVFI